MTIIQGRREGRREERRELEFAWLQFIVPLFIFKKEKERRN